MNRRRMDLLRRVLAVPTAPFHEHRVAETVRSFAADAGLRFDTDGAGNVLLRLPAGSADRKDRPHWVFAAHMDHPGFSARVCRGRSVWAEFRGGVGLSYFRGASVCFFSGDEEARGIVASARRNAATRCIDCRIELAEPARPGAGAFGMWDLPAVRVRGSRVAARACDDLVGVAAVLAALEEIAARGDGAKVTGLLTRAEETGFVGALAACELGTIPDGALVVALEASAAQAQASLGGGAVIRVGDKARTFTPELTALVQAVANDLSERKRGFRAVSALMPGGTCEATAYAARGHMAGGLCVPLGNYHNQGRKGRILPERIDLGDFDSMVTLLTALAADGRRPSDARDALNRRLDERLEKGRAYLGPMKK